MAFQSVFYKTDLSDILIDQINHKFNLEIELNKSKLVGDIIEPKIRNSDNTWISTEHWLGGFVWHYIDKANKNNFLYDISNIDGDSIQYTQYSIGQYYNWHTDTSIDQYFLLSEAASSELSNEYANEKIGIEYELCRKLSFSIQLSGPEEYEGGELQFQKDDGSVYFAPKEKGVIAVFDSRARHRVRKVTKGVRKSLVGWVVGPRWK
jgi:PKHD-type hydroxylase